MDDVVCLPALVAEASMQQHRRQHQLEAYIRLLETRGEPIIGEPDGIRRLPRKYMKKDNCGRMYTSGPSLQSITKSARKAALSGIPGDVFELDMYMSSLTLLLRAVADLLSVVEV